jgi:hypothetical protein
MQYKIAIRHFDSDGKTVLDRTVTSAHRAFVSAPVHKCLDVALEEIPGLPDSTVQTFALTLKDAAFNPTPQEPKPSGIWAYEMFIQHQLQDGSTANSVRIVGAHRLCMKVACTNLEVGLSQILPGPDIADRFHLMIREVF